MHWTSQYARRSAAWLTARAAAVDFIVIVSFLGLRGRLTFSPHALHYTALQALRLHRLFTAVVIVHQLLQGNSNLDFNTRHHVLIPVTAAGAHSMFHLHVLGLQGIVEGQTCIPEGCVELKV
jgi:hypothetical protein